MFATNTSQLLAFWPGSSCTARCAQLQFCKFCCPLHWRLTLQYEDSTAAKTFFTLASNRAPAPCNFFSVRALCVHVLFSFRNETIIHKFSIYYSSTRSNKVPGLMFSCKYSFLHISILQSLFLHVMTARHYLKGSATSMSSSVSIQCIHCFLLCCQDTVNEHLQIYVNCLKLFMEMKIYLAQNFIGWSGDKMVNEVQKVVLAKVRDQNSK